MSRETFGSIVGKIKLVLPVCVSKVLALWDIANDTYMTMIDNTHQCMPTLSPKHTHLHNCSQRNYRKDIKDYIKGILFESSQIIHQIRIY